MFHNLSSAQLNSSSFPSHWSRLCSRLPSSQKFKHFIFTCSFLSLCRQGNCFDLFLAFPSITGTWFVFFPLSLTRITLKCSKSILFTNTSGFYTLFLNHDSPHGRQKSGVNIIFLSHHFSHFLPIFSSHSCFLSTAVQGFSHWKPYTPCHFLLICIHHIYTSMLNSILKKQLFFKLPYLPFIKLY